MIALAIGVVLSQTQSARGHGGHAAPGGGGSGGSGFNLFGLGEARPKAIPEPFGGQKVCPVTGEPLGSHPVAVETHYGKEKQSFFGKLFGKASAKGLTIYVCCEGCAAKVRQDPGRYLVRVINEKNLVLDRSK